MKATTWKFATALLLALGLTAPLEAQGRGNGRDRDDDRREDSRDWDDDRDDDSDWDDDRDDDSDWDDDRDDDRWDDDDRDDRRREGSRTRSRHERGNGPSFCRSGRGHPVFGWEWCRERGWDRSSSSRYPVRWERRTWEDVIFRRQDRKPSLDRRDLGSILGDVIFGRVDTRRREIGAPGDWLGRWVDTSAGRELWITAGGIPIARLVDRNGDRRVDNVYVAER